MARSNLKAIFWMLIHVISAAFVNLGYRFLSEESEKLFIPCIYNVSAFFVLLPIFFIFRKYISKSKYWYIHILRALCYVIAQILLVYAYNNMEFVEIASTTLTYPLIAIVAASIFLKDKLDSGRVIALIIGFIGAVVVVNPIYGNFNMYSFFVLSTVFLWVVFDILVKKFDFENSFSQFFYLIVFMALLSLFPVAWMHGEINTNFPIWKIFILGVLISIYMFSEFISVIQTSSLGITAPFYFTNLVFAVLSGYFIFNEKISTGSLIGSLLILSSILYIVYTEYCAAKSKKLSSYQSSL